MPRRTTLLAAAAATCLLATAPVAGATPGSGVSAVERAKTTVGGKDYHLRTITIAPGGHTGWHFHDGDLYGVVTGGTLTHYGKDCAVDGVYPKGSSVVEPAGPDEVHIGRNLGTEPVVLEVLYVLPAGSPFAQDAPAPGCAA
ncbi:quercetin dioxygenase-like cupin family protein [Crossiella equi]|uniref:Quercetin dioxygenase-like cupin family protein n=1 Tax=Crossiella equi TaxID=130796 RepID=A0ABS5AA14_9PSEU|nr:cupin domain-containing protein [Crossiella equi]MBP2473132.1 quercetin dioxygenase-like cupin family protein [Crossiella equi]